ncbi:MAG: hypothetical protein WC505_07590 [Patescibacteria group bacterium]
MFNFSTRIWQFVNLLARSFTKASDDPVIEGWSLPREEFIRLTEVEHKRTVVQKELGELRLKYAKLTQAYNIQNEAFLDLEKELAGLRTKLENLVSGASPGTLAYGLALKDRLAGARSAIGRLENDKTTMSVLIKQLTAERDALQRRYDDIDTIFSANDKQLKQENSILKTELAAIKGERQASASAMMALRRQYGARENEPMEQWLARMAKAAEPKIAVKALRKRTKKASK